MEKMRLFAHFECAPNKKETKAIEALGNEVEMRFLDVKDKNGKDDTVLQLTSLETGKKVVLRGKWILNHYNPQTDVISLLNISLVAGIEAEDLRGSMLKNYNKRLSEGKDPVKSWRLETICDKEEKKEIKKRSKRK